VKSLEATVESARSHFHSALGTKHVQNSFVFTCQLNWAW